ncbi:hypothetical protein GCM10025759_19370 [Lysobacter panacisoli]|uniref:Uncharacterized protein n=2 Tax=Lysobacter panacisoli TaxID=1255263 RepID=A0ABP9LG96_9GAMM
MLDISTDNAAVAERLKKAIADLPYSKSEVADRLGVSPQAVTGWESTGRIGKKSLAGLALMSGRSVHYFLTGEQEPPQGDWGAILGRLPGNLAVIREESSTMLPRLNPGDSALYDPEDRIPEDGRLFVVVAAGLGNESPTVKRCVELGGDTFFDALNPASDPAWSKPRKMEDSHHPITILGRVRWIGSWEG